MAKSFEAPRRTRLNVEEPDGPAAVIVTDPEGTILYWNETAEELYGWPAAEVLGHNVVDVTPTELSRTVAEQIMDCLRRGEPWEGPFRVQHRAGYSFMVLVQNTPVIDDAGEMVAIIGTSHAA